MVSEADELETNFSLLERVKNPHDEMAWHAFVDRYGHKIYAWTAI